MSELGKACGIVAPPKALVSNRRLDLGNSVANFTLSGSDPSFKQARHGLIIESRFADKDGHPLKNPIIHLDEEAIITRLKIFRLAVEKKSKIIHIYLWKT